MAYCSRSTASDSKITDPYLNGGQLVNDQILLVAHGTGRPHRVSSLFDMKILPMALNL